MVFLRFSYRRNGLFRKVVFFPFVFLPNQKLDTALDEMGNSGVIDEIKDEIMTGTGTGASGASGRPGTS